MPFAPDTRAAQPSTSKGLGAHFMSPRGRLKRRHRYAIPVEVPGQDRKRQRLQSELNALLQHRNIDGSSTDPAQQVEAPSKMINLSNLTT